FDFSLPLGRNRTIFSLNVDNTDLHRGDYSECDGMKVGLLNGSSQNQSLEGFAADNDFTYTPVYFDDSDALSLALKQGDIDAILSSNLRKSENEKVLDIIEEADFYAIVKKGNTTLLDEINYAIEQMDINEGDWKNVLFYQFYGPVYSSALTFTERETKYIREVVSGDKVITVTAFGDRAPYSYTENGVLAGIMPDYFAEVMKLAGLPYELVTPKDKADYFDMVATNKATVVIDSVESVGVAEGSDYRGFNTNSYMTARMARVIRQDFKGNVKVIAASDSQGLELIDKSIFERYTVKRCATGEDAMNAVLNEEADVAYVYAYTAQTFVDRDKTDSLYYSLMNGMSTSFSMYIGENNDHELVTILNKCIKQISEETINQIVSKYTTFPTVEMSFMQYLEAHPEIIIVAVLVLVVIIFVILALYLRGRWNKKLLHATEQANKAKTNFLNSMSHDIRTPMNAIIGFASLATTNLDDKEKTRNYLGKIMISGNHLLNLINDVLDMSRIESGKVRIEEKETSLPEIAHDLKTIAQADVKAKQLDFRMEAVNVTNETILCDKLRLNQVLLNILSNAIKYTMPGGAVGVRIAQTSAAADGYACYEFSVKDTGI
ncbi:MAG: transporter substrate-binding domain-containing protein, partial [Clostridiales bacterium]|nr:transporter substrate-binding domain-containing protein [Clostridiales bacterium]